MHFSDRQLANIRQKTYIVGSQSFNFTPNFLSNGGVLGPNFVFLDENVGDGFWGTPCITFLHYRTGNIEISGYTTHAQCTLHNNFRSRNNGEKLCSRELWNFRRSLSLQQLMRKIYVISFDNVNIDIQPVDYMNRKIVLRQSVE